VSEDPDWELNADRPNGYKKKGGGENFMLQRAFSRAGGFFSAWASFRKHFLSPNIVLYFCY
jgi:hypothetical protein